MLLLIRQLTGQNRSYLPPFPSLSVHPRASHSPCRYRFRQATRCRAREAGRQPAHLGPSKEAPPLISRRPLLLGHPSQDLPISLENTHYTTIIKFQNEFKWLLLNQVSNDCTGFKKSGNCVYRLFRNELKLT